jgi:transcriptional regulator with XRE-family HTH domain
MGDQAKRSFRNDSEVAMNIVTNDIDEHIGRRLALRRHAVGLTQQQLAKIVGVSFQQIQRYECGANKLGAARLWSLAVAIHVPVNYFFEGFADKANGIAAEGSSIGNALAVVDSDLLEVFSGLGEMSQQQLLEFARVLRAREPAAA